MSRIRNAAAQIARPLQEFLRTETTGGVLLLVAACAALVWVNLPNDSYLDFWGKHVAIDLGFVDLNLTLVEWVNDGLMTIFFFVVGLEIKRELLSGELAGARRAALPVAAAIGGMLVPATIFLAINAGSSGVDGWGIPMATDIAFSIGLLALLGARVPSGLKVFLLALAIVDDIGAILVIAVFYTDSIAFGWLALGLAMFALTVIFGWFGVRDLVVYLTIAAVAWLAFHESGVHATVAGVALGLLTPIDPHYDAPRLHESADALARQVLEGRAENTRAGNELAESALRELEELARESQSPLERLEHALHPWTSYAIVPIFALANAGVALSGSALREAVTSQTGWGVALGLMLGKPIGIVLASFLAVRLGLAVLPSGARWLHVSAMSMVAGIGFTVSLFITNLAYNEGELIQDAKIGILVGSALVSAAGLVALRLVLPEPQPEMEQVEV
jgi:NhaA family Na+:H+ antiporter